MRLCRAYRLRAGNTVTATDWRGTMERARLWFGERKGWLNRGDLGLVKDAIMSWQEEAPEWPKYHFKLNLVSRVRAAACQVPEQVRQSCATLQTCQLAEGLI